MGANALIKSATLYELADNFIATAEKLAEMDLPPEVIADTLDGEKLPIEQKAYNVAAFLLNLESSADQKYRAAKSMTARADADMRLAENLRKYLLNNMQRCAITRINHPEFSLAVKSNQGYVEIFDERQIPLEYMRQQEPPPPAPDKTAIKAAFKSGQDVPGARIVKTQRLEIK